MQSTVPADDVPVRQAASILVVDDRPDLHVLIGRRRRSSGFVPGMVVFPGGAVDDDDRSVSARSVVPEASVPGLSTDEAASFLHAGLRETVEEVGLWVGGEIPCRSEDFPHAGWWVTPPGAPRRYDTHFFLARYRGGDVAADQLELTDAWWGRPDEILDEIEAGELEAIYPTIRFFERLTQFRSVDAVMTAALRGQNNAKSAGWVGF